MKMVTVHRSVTTYSCKNKNLKAVDSFESLVTIYQTTWRHITGDSYLYSYHRENLKYLHMLPLLN
jgi:hypothetical protein